MCLNQTCAYVWKHCNGKTEASSFLSLLNQEFKVKVDEEFIFLTLDTLAKADLLENYEPRKTDIVTRRKAILNYALPMALLPLVTIVLAPLAIHAQSGTCAATPSASCSSAAQCSDANTPGCADVGCTCGSFTCGGDSCCAAGSIACS